MKRFFGFFTVCLLACLFLAASTASAGVKEVLGTLKDAASTGNLIAGLAVVILAWIFKTIPNDKIYGIVTAVFTKLGIAATLGLSRFKFTAPLWNKYIEPWVIDFIDNTIGAAVKGFIAGLRSDNTDG